MESLVLGLNTRADMMGHPARVQLIKRTRSHQWDVNSPAALPDTIEFETGKLVEWFVESKKKLSLKRDSKKEGISSVKVRASVKMKIPEKKHE